MQAGSKRFSLSTGCMFIACGFGGGNVTPARSRDCSSSHCGSCNRLLVDGREPGSIHWLVRLILCKGVRPWNGLDMFK